MKQSYHTDIAIQYKLGILNNQLTKQIPSSTLHNWKNKDFSNLVGSEYVEGFEQNLDMIKEFLSRQGLLKAAKSIYYIYSAYQKIFDTIKNKNKVLKNSKSIVIKTIDLVKENIGLKKAINLFDISQQQYYSWKRIKECKKLKANTCRKLYYNQVTLKEIETIKCYLKHPDYLQWSMASVYYKMIRDKTAFISLTTFYKYANLLMLQRAKPEKKKYDTGIRAEAPKRILHMDVTIYRPLDHTKVYLYFLADNYSRYILNWKASLNYSAKISFENISEAYRKYNLEKITQGIDLICDDGSENKGEVDKFLSKNAGNIQKLVAQSDILFSNSIVEAVNKRMKYDFLFTTRLKDIEQTQQYLENAVKQYNNKPHTSLYGLTPDEVYNGMVPDKFMFKEAIQMSAKKRKEINLNLDCEGCI